MADDQYAHHNVASSRAALQLIQPANTKVNASALRRFSLLTGCMFMLATVGTCLVHHADHNNITIINNCTANCAAGKQTCLVLVKFATGHFKGCHITNLFMPLTSMST